MIHLYAQSLVYSSVLLHFLRLLRCTTLFSFVAVLKKKKLSRGNETPRIFFLKKIVQEEENYQRDTKQFFFSIPNHNCTWYNFIITYTYKYTSINQRKSIRKSKILKLFNFNQICLKLKPRRPCRPRKGNSMQCRKRNLSRTFISQLN